MTITKMLLLMDIKSTNLVLLSFLLIITAIFGLNLQFSGAESKESDSDLEEEIDSQSNDEESEDSSTEKGSPGTGETAPSSSVKDQPLTGQAVADQQQENQTITKSPLIDLARPEWSTYKVSVKFQSLIPTSDNKENNVDGSPRVELGGRMVRADAIALFEITGFTDWKGDGGEWLRGRLRSR